MEAFFMGNIKYFLLTKSAGLYINLLAYLYPVAATRLAYKLFSHPRQGRLDKNNLPSILQQATLKSLYVNGQSFQSYCWQGGQKTILLVHGWESNASRWEQIIPYLLDKNYTVVAIDAPAHGLSNGREFNVPTYAECINAASIAFKPDHLIGHSIGGAACVFYLSKFPHKQLKSVVLLGAPSDLRVLIYNYAQLLSLSNRITHLLDDYFFDKFKFRLDEFSGQIFGRKISVPGLIVHDTSDVVVKIAEAHKINSSWKTATLVETIGLGHSMHNDVLYQQITTFIQSKCQQPF